MSIWDFDEMLKLKDGDILFFDEVLNGNPTVLNACLTLLESRMMISGKKLPDVMVVAAANPQGMVPITPQIKERFVWYDVVFDPMMWKDYMMEKYGMPRDMSTKFCSLINKEDFKGRNFYTPRSVDKAVSSMIRDCPTPYEEVIMPILENPIKNRLKSAVRLSADRVLEPSEMIPWLEFMKLKTEKDEVT